MSFLDYLLKMRSNGAKNVPLVALLSLFFLRMFLLLLNTYDMYDYIHSVNLRQTLLQLSLITLKYERQNQTHSTLFDRPGSN